MDKKKDYQYYQCNLCKGEKGKFRNKHNFVQHFLKEHLEDYYSLKPEYKKSIRLIDKIK